MLLIYFLNINSSPSSEELNSTINVIFSALSDLLLFAALIIYISSFLIKDQDNIDLKKPSLYRSRKGTIEIGKVMKGERRIRKFFLSLKDLERHMFVCGSTGSGKSNFVQNLLINFKKLYNIPFLIAEFKGEYAFLQDLFDDLIIIRPGENFSLNIFNPEGAHPQIHAERIFDILKSGQFLDESSEFSPQMERVLVDILTIVCKNPKLQSWKGFFTQCDEYLETQKTKIPMVHQSIISIQNRIRRFSIGPLKKVFSTRHKLKINDLLNMSVLVDLSSIIRLGGEKEDALFFLNMVLKYLWDKNLTQGAYNFKGIKHLTIVEDAQYFAPRALTHQTKLTSYLEDIALLQRGTGECLISIATRPNVSEEILANCGVLVTFKNHMQRSFICELLNLEEENEDYLSILEEGQCIARVNSVKRPFLLWVPYIERHWIKRGDVNRKNKLILKTLAEDNNKMLKVKEFFNDAMDKSEEDSLNRKIIQNLNGNLKEAAEIKYFIDNMLIEDENENEKFVLENYCKCPECFSIYEKNAQSCPYCGFSEKNKN
ncbi:MAG: helicase HerA domain-containing protein [Candidatus Thorarchaeota archaeon]